MGEADARALAARVRLLPGTLLDSVLGGARRAWPALSVDAHAYLTHAVVHAAREPDLAGGLTELAAGDLYLAFAAANGAPAAVRELETSFIDQLPAVLSRGASAASRADVVQQLRMRLLLPGQRGSRPKLLDYAGRGPLAGWLRVAATRLSLDAARCKRPNESSSEETLLALPAMIADPELEFVRARHAAPFEQAFRDALAELSDEDRNLLRLRLVDDLTIDELAALFRVHRATAARWLVRTRETLETRTRELLEARLGLSPSELASLVVIMRSHLDVSVGVLAPSD